MIGYIERPLFIDRSKSFTGKLKKSDIHKILENVVYLHLRMAGYTVTVGQEGNTEIDFIAQKSGEKIYVQVAYMLTNEGTINREFGNVKNVQINRCVRN